MLRGRYRWATLALAGVVCLGLVTCGKGGSDKPKPKPECYLVLPASGTILGGNTITVFTRNFKDDFSINLPLVTIDGVLSSSVIIINPLELSVVVPAGESKLVFAYEPAAFTTGVRLMTLALLVLGSWALILIRQARRSTPA